MRRLESDTGPRRSRALAWVLAALVFVTACEPHSGALLAPTTTAALAPSNPTLLRFDANAPAIESPDTSFVATAGERTSFRVFFEGGKGSERFLDFELQGRSLYRYPPGHPRAGRRFVDGDTVTITVSINPETLSIQFGPKGLEFSEDKPARIEIGYLFADPDLDGDGTPDPQLLPSIRMFRHPTPGAPWQPLDSKNDLLDKRVKFDEVVKFSRYALAI